MAIKWIKGNLAVIMIIINLIITGWIGYAMMYLDLRYQTKEQAKAELVEIRTEFKSYQLENTSQHSSIITALNNINLALVKIDSQSKAIEDHEIRIRALESKRAGGK